MALHAKTMATKIPPVEATVACSGVANGNMAAKASDSVSDNLHYLTESSFSFHNQVRKDCLSWNGPSENSFAAAIITGKAKSATYRL